MGSDMIVALKEASAHATTLFGLNHHAAANLRHTVCVVPAESTYVMVQPFVQTPLAGVRVTLVLSTMAWLRA